MVFLVGESVWLTLRGTTGSGFQRLLQQHLARLRHLLGLLHLQFRARLPLLLPLSERREENQGVFYRLRQEAGEGSEAGVGGEGLNCNCNCTGGYFYFFLPGARL